MSESIKEQLKHAPAAVLFIMGQSNAHAHEQYLSEDEILTQPLQHVFTLCGREHHDLQLQTLHWSGYTTKDSNLGEEQDDTARMAYYVAKAWEAAIDGGAALPDLYLVQLSIGAQAIIKGMWNMDKEPVMKPGTLEEVDISLYPYAKRVLALVHEDLSARFRDPVMLGLHWIGSEEDSGDQAPHDDVLVTTYHRFFTTLMESVGQPCPLYLYKILCYRRPSVQDRNFLNHTFEGLCRDLPDTHLVETDRLCPFYDPQDQYYGIFAEDNVHYLAKTQKFFADHLMSSVL